MLQGRVSCTTSAFGTAAGIVTRCPLELKLKRLPEGQAWQGKISYQNFTQELRNASEVDKAIRQGEWIWLAPSPLNPPLTLSSIQGDCGVTPRAGFRAEEAGSAKLSSLKGVLAVLQW